MKKIKKDIQAGNQKVQYKTTERCRKCGTTINELTTFSGGVCVDCYAKVYEKLPEDKRIPDFTNTINL